MKALEEQLLLVVVLVLTVTVSRSIYGSAPAFRGAELTGTCSTCPACS